MISGASSLLSLIGSGVSAAATRRASHAPSSRGASFEQALRQAHAPAFSTGLPVRIAEDANVKLTPDQLTRIAQAMDQADASGSQRAVVLIDGLALEVDVAMRTITRSIAYSSAEDAHLTSPAMSAIDAVVQAPPARDASRRGTHPLSLLNVHAS